MRSALVAILLSVACSAPAGPPAVRTPPRVLDGSRDPPPRELFEVSPISLRLRAPWRPTVIAISTPPAYDGPAPSATFARAAAIDATARRHARARLAALHAIRRVQATTLREHAAVDRSAPDAEDRLQKIRSAHQRQISRAEAEYVKANTALRVLLDKHASVLTLAGVVLRADVHLHHADELVEHELAEMVHAGLEPDDAVRADLGIARDVIDAAFADPQLATAAERDLDARYLRAIIYHHDEPETGAQLLIQVARDFPTSHVAERSYHAAGQALFGIETPLAREMALEAFRWLAAHGNDAGIRAMAHFRLGQLQDRVAAWPQSLASFCKVLDDPQVDVAIADETRSYLARALVRGGPAPLEVACAAQPLACPCLEPVVSDVAAHFRRIEDSASLALVVERARASFPTSTHVATWSCDLVRIAERTGDDAAIRRERARHASELASIPGGAASEPCKRPPAVDDRGESDIARARLASSGALAWCLERALEDRRLATPTRLALEIAVDEHGKPDRVTVEPADVDTNECVRAWATNQRWPDLARTRIVAPLALEP